MAERGRPKAELVLSDNERETLERWARRPKSTQALALRCRIVLECASGLTNREVSRRIGVSEPTVSKWRRRFVTKRLEGLHDEARPGVPRSITDDHVEALIVATLEQTPTDATHWSTRSMAKATGMSQSAVSRIWRAFGLKPHLVDSFKLSPDPQFVEKVRDVVGLYLNPPEGALVLCVDEKTQIQALDRTSPVLPLRPGLPERRTHDYVRGGTTNLYAALDIASGQVIADMTEHHRALEFRRFLNLINNSVPKDLDVHVVVDNSSTHKTPEIHRWLLRHPRFTLHFTPTYSSWMNLVERWFAELTTKWLRRGTHRSTKELEAAITTWIANWNEDPKPFVWHKSADEILDTLAAYSARESPTQDTRRLLGFGLDNTLSDRALSVPWGGVACDVPNRASASGACRSRPTAARRRNGPYRA